MTAQHEYTAARAHYERSIGLNPANANNQMLYAILLHEHFDEQELARSHYIAARDLDPSRGNDELDGVFGVI